MRTPRFTLLQSFSSPRSLSAPIQNTANRRQRLLLPRTGGVCEPVVEVAVLEVVLLAQVLQDPALLQSGPVQRCLAPVLGQARLLQPGHQVAAQEGLSRRPLPAPARLLFFLLRNLGTSRSLIRVT